ncbi:MAG: hypothetical protein CSB48_14820 [Proteobacteria bacterium]|nr:MAG: hypothetical protein CSB48_14820 [Pseudomonadota bacterium]PIE39992.1 MAG: hypothetical protein CSA51_03085 [Gammaproteobacteria bacterium]
MNTYVILCVDDEREVLDSVMHDLEPLGSHFIIEGAESAPEAREVIAELEAEGRVLALILCDHVMPEVKGVDFLIELNENPHTKVTRKVLLTGQAGLESTIEAVNRGGLDYYIAKPWDATKLLETVVDQLTTFVIANEEDLIAYSGILDSERLFEAIHQSG